ncbi:PTS mannose/fructose/sorbose transporter subunit IIB [Suicoccus acidiformans]|uniref:PTS mannose/fructose/sorbose transporter subunit IIB n=1 Tax=Suicoccus acidiformans TaxID=2036206 RepID=A0A347WII0_9LACT|nr:PTS sugar transporter subunit IIB [Suicoccus acidiformans]AXY24887.1 PTS mannose/fructose/sorbose transporter subunit IIB [Suicoccus acidiformans]
MGQINFARVDGRLIHGQVATGWSNSTGINTIYVVDNPTANDDFMKMLYVNLQNNYSFGIKVFTIEEVVQEWNDNEFGNDKVMLLFKDVDHAYETRKAGVPFEVLNVGGSPKTDDNKFVADSVALTEEQFNMLKNLNDEYNIDVFFQTMPSASKKKLSEVTY